MEDIYSKEFLERITSVVPTKLQIDFHNLGYYSFIHFGLNTFTGKEWGSGQESPSVFELKNIDTDSWVQDLKSTGSKAVIITAKHHDGFCLFPSKYTDYTIAATKYMDGKGDIIKQMAESCKKYDMKLGIYLSPWDRHELTYGTDAYNDYFCNQLTELCTQYGPIFCFWFDGACGEGPNGKKQIYAWERFYEIIRKLQPGAAITNCGPDFRWIGNENGKARESEFAIVPKRAQFYSQVSEISQKDGKKAPIRLYNQKLGHREQLADESLVWWPSEMDIPVTRRGWFWSRRWELFYLRSVKNLEKCYYNSVGHNATLIINVPPNKSGVMPRVFIDRLIKTKDRIDARFRNQIDIKEKSFSDKGVILKFPKATVKTVVLAEDVNYSQRVESFRILNQGRTVYEGKTIGFQKFCILKKPIKNCSELEIVIDKTRGVPHFFKVELY